MENKKDRTPDKRFKDASTKEVKAKTSKTAKEVKEKTTKATKTVKEKIA